MAAHWTGVLKVKSSNLVETIKSSLYYELVIWMCGGRVGGFEYWKIRQPCYRKNPLTC